MIAAANIFSVLAGYAALVPEPSAPIPIAETAAGMGWAGWILWLPAISTVMCGLCAALRVKNKLPAWITVGLLGSSFLMTLALWLQYDQPVVIHLLDWIVLGGDRWTFIANFSLYVDSLTLLWMLFVTGLGTLIALYASEYMEADVRGGYARFFAGISVFLFAMTALVMADNLLMLYLGWEGVGFASYWLIGYYYRKPSAVAAAKKAFIVNRIGDLGLALAIYLIWHNFGTVEYRALFEALDSGSYSAEAGGWSIKAIPYLLMLGAFGKSAQIPLYVWLPDAMEGPTPVSALIHAATMVTAGVFLVARMYPVFLLEPASLTVVAWIGGLTALLAATIAMAQHDIKRIFAYSTISQLGYMFMGLGMLSSVGAAYHVFTHAFFKAVLFLTAGVVMHGFAGQVDLRKVSGLRHLPGFRITSFTMLYACACLAGVPLITNGFWSKDAIMAQAFISTGPGFRALGVIAIITAFLTAYYAFRVWFRVCAGPVHFEAGEEQPDDDHAPEHGEFRPHAPRLAVNLVLIVITIGAVGSIFLKGWAGERIEDSTAAYYSPLAQGAGFWEDPHHWMPWVASAVGLLGIAVAGYFHLVNRKAADGLKNAMLANPATRWLPTAMENKWYVDELYHLMFRGPLWLGGHILNLFDRYIIDMAIVDGVARVPRLLGRGFQPLSNGILQSYAVSMAGGVALLGILVFLMPQLVDWLSRWMGGAG
ncbi:MAG: NADH-quinone oxidoreductase subunit L [Planctomycetota bacterium]|nr:NADH-quinone oxidoreductase subunit L [Planctomycetota bacterium]